MVAGRPEAGMQPTDAAGRQSGRAPVCSGTFALAADVAGTRFCAFDPWCLSLRV
jgi:hypothetical protein